MLELLTLILIFMIFAAILAIETEDAVAAVVSMGAVGFGLSVCFILLRAPDVALAQIAVEVVVLILLLRGTIGLEVKTISGRRDKPGLYAGIVLVGLFLALGVLIAGEFPRFGEPSFARFQDSASWFYLNESLSRTGAANVVNAILMDFRGLDTLGGMMALFAAVIGAIALVRRKTRPEN